MGRIYLYGIVEGREAEASAGVGVDGQSPAYTVANDGIGCVVSDYRGDDFGALPREKLVRSLLAHQQVVERAMQDRAVLPVKFGTFLGGCQDVQSLLCQGHHRFAHALAAMRDKLEIEVAATWDTGRVLQEIGREEEVARAREALAGKGQVSLMERVRLGQLVKARLDQRRGCYRERMLKLLRPVALDVAPNLLLSEDLVMNLAFLVDRCRQHDFDEAVGQLDELFQRELSFRMVGPLPPYSFSTVEITPLAARQVEEARRTLGLGERISEVEVRKAYRRLAAQAVTAVSPGTAVSEDAGPGERLAQLRRASELLLLYCLGRKAVQEGPEQPGPARDAERLFAIAIKGSRSDEVEAARFGVPARA